MTRLGALHTLYDIAESHVAACLCISTTIAPEHKAARHSRRRRRRLRPKIFIYPEEMVALWASKKVNRP